MQLAPAPTLLDRLIGWLNPRAGLTRHARRCSSGPCRTVTAAATSATVTDRATVSTCATVSTGLCCFTTYRIETITAGTAVTT